MNEEELIEMITKAMKNIVGNNTLKIGQTTEPNWQTISINGEELKYRMYVSDNCGWGYVSAIPSYDALIPTRIIFNDPCTICFFPDGSKVVARCEEGEEWNEEEGVMACIMKKIFPSRNAFKKLVQSGYHQPDKE